MALDDNLKKLETLLAALDQDHLGRKDFIAAFDKVLDYTKEEIEALKAEVQEVIESTNATYNDYLNRLQTATDQTTQSLTEQTTTFNQEITNSLQSLQSLTKRLEERVVSIKNGEDADEERVIENVLERIKIPEYRAPIMDGPEEIRNKLELLEGEEQLAAIKELRKEIEALKKQSNRQYVVGGAASGGRIVKYHDLSASLDGSTTTFSLPAFYRVISVHLSSFPNILRPTTDYTTDAGAMTITFTSQIDPATSLAVGQTCIIIYSET